MEQEERASHEMRMILEEKRRQLNEKKQALAEEIMKQEQEADAEQVTLRSFFHVFCGIFEQFSHALVQSAWAGISNRAHSDLSSCLFAFTGGAPSKAEANRATKG